MMWPDLSPPRLKWPFPAWWGLGTYGPHRGLDNVIPASCRALRKPRLDMTCGHRVPGQARRGQPDSARAARRGSGPVDHLASRTRGSGPASPCARCRVAPCWYLGRQGLQGGEPQPVVDVVAGPARRRLAMTSAPASRQQRRGEGRGGAVRSPPRTVRAGQGGMAGAPFPVTVEAKQAGQGGSGTARLGGVGDPAEPAGKLDARRAGIARWASISSSTRIGQLKAAPPRTA